MSHADDWGTSPYGDESGRLPDEWKAQHEAACLHAGQAFGKMQGLHEARFIGKTLVIMAVLALAMVKFLGPLMGIQTDVGASAVVAAVGLRWAVWRVFDV